MSTFQQRNARYKRLQTRDMANNKVQQDQRAFKKFNQSDQEKDEVENKYNYSHVDADEHEEIELHRSVNDDTDIGHGDGGVDEDEDDVLTPDYYVVGGGKRTIGTQGIEAGNIEYYATKKFMQKTIWTLAVILFYLTLSICLTFYQNRLLKSLKFPLCIVTYHMIFKLFMAGCVRSAWKFYVGENRVSLDLRSNLRRMAPTGIASGIDIGFSMWALELVTISLYTMTKSTTIIFIMIFSLILGLEKKSWSLVLIVGLISSGLFMFTYKSTDFNLMGFIFLLVASLSSGVRWTLAQFIIQKAQLGLHNPIDMIFHMQPWMIATLVPMALCFEGGRLWQVIVNLGTYTSWECLSVVFRVSFGAVLAFFMECSEFMVLSKTSSLTLSIAGIFKETCQLALAVEFAGDQLRPMNVVGMIMCLMGIMSHLLHKFLMLRHINALQILENNHHSANATNSNDNSAAAGGDHATFNSRATVPLLEALSDSYDSENDEDEPNASDVIYDVLKRRDMQR